MAPHSSTLAWKIPWTEEPGRLQSMGLLTVRHDWVIHFHFSLPCIREGNGNPLQCSCLENPGDGGAWWAAVHGVAQSRTRLKRLGGGSSSCLTFHYLALFCKLLRVFFFFSLCVSATRMSFSLEQGPCVLLTSPGHETVPGTHTRQNINCLNIECSCLLCISVGCMPFSDTQIHQ